MKFSRAYKDVAEVKIIKAPKGKAFHVPVRHFEQETGKTAPKPHFFNEQGSVCFAVETFYEVWLNDLFVSNHFLNNNATKTAKNLLKGD